MSQWQRAFYEAMWEERPVCIFNHPFVRGRYVLNWP